MPRKKKEENKETLNDFEAECARVEAKCAMLHKKDCTEDLISSEKEFFSAYRSFLNSLRLFAEYGYNIDEVMGLNSETRELFLRVAEFCEGKPVIRTRCMGCRNNKSMNPFGKKCELECRFDHLLMF